MRTGPLIARSFRILQRFEPLFRGGHAGDLVGRLGDQVDNLDTTMLSLRQPKIRTHPKG